MHKCASQVCSIQLAPAPPISMLTGNIFAIHDPLGLLTTTLKIGGWGGRHHNTNISKSTALVGCTGSINDVHSSWCWCSLVASKIFGVAQVQLVCSRLCLIERDLNYMLDLYGYLLQAMPHLASKTTKRQ